MNKLPPYKPNQIEETMLDSWDKEKTFADSLTARQTAPRYTFYDGPPFANGQPHFGHSLVTAIKDAIGRYKTMRGYLVERRNGWDCHGLPVEFAIENKFNISGKKQIMELGLDKFNAACRDSVFAYKHEWEDFFRRIGRWTDTKNAYATIDTSYTESVWWVFSQIYQKGLIYRGYKSMPYCPRCATPLSNFEVNEGYRDNVEDPSLYVKFKLTDDKAYLLAWTTTPWSLPGNVALAVDPKARYVRVQLKDDQGASEELILAKDRLVALDSEYEQLDEFAGQKLVGKTYQPVVQIEKKWVDKKMYRVWAADFVSIEDGTGVLHIAPAFGEDDLTFGQDNDLPVIQSIDADGKIKNGYGVDELVGKFFKSADKGIIELLTKAGLVYSAELQPHTYPFCYRCDTPLLYYAIDTWFLAVTKLKGDLLKTAAKINWTPAHIKDGRFGKWLEGARDWAIGRNRYWGAPMPVWQNVKDPDDLIVVSSIVELEKLAGKKVGVDLHRPYIDEVEINRDGKVYRRVEDVLDCWFESGSMPYGQWHYPFENKQHFEASFPADYIGEGLDQTRLWFYVLHVVSTALREEPAFKNVLVNGMIMAADGQKLSKRLKNYPDMDDVFAEEGADALRYYLLSSYPAMSGDYMRFDRDSLRDVNRNIFMTLHHSVGFLTMYAEVDKWQPEGIAPAKDSHNLLDQWLIARVNNTAKEVAEAADKYELARAINPISDLIDDISNWYIRRSRRRFWKSENDSDKYQAYQNLHWALVTTCQILAPWAPFMSDYLYRILTAEIKSAQGSVHLSDWPAVKSLSGNQTELITQMELVRQIVTDGLSARAKAGIKVRQPLDSATVTVSTHKLSDELLEIIKSELNLKSVTQITGQKPAVKLNTNITQELKNEGIARDIVRQIQSVRKDSGLEVDDRIEIILTCENDEIKAAIKQFSELIKKEVLATKLTSLEKIENQPTKTVTIEKQNLHITIKK